MLRWWRDVFLPLQSQHPGLLLLKPFFNRCIIHPSKGIVFHPWHQRSSFEKRGIPTELPDLCLTPPNSGLIVLDLKTRQLQGGIRGLNRHRVWGSCHRIVRLVSARFTKTIFSQSGARPRAMDFFLYFWGGTCVDWHIGRRAIRAEPNRILQEYTAFKSIRRNLFIEAIGPAR